MNALLLSILTAVPPDVLIALVGTVVVGCLLPLVFTNLDRAKQDKILALTKGAYLVIAAISKETPTKLDDALALVVQRVADEMGRELKPAEVNRVKGIAVAMQADPTRPDIAQPTPAELALAINLPKLPAPAP